MTMQLYDMETELIVLGTLQRFQQQIPEELKSQIVADLFSMDSHRRVLEIIRAERDPNATHLSLEKAQGQKCLVEYSNATAHALPVGGLEASVRHLQKHAERRRLTRASAEVEEMASAGEVAHARKLLAEHASAPPIGLAQGFDTGDEWMGRLLERLRALEEGRGAGIRTGWRLIDEVLSGSLGGGLVPGHLGVIGGRPGSGKSSLMVQILGQVLEEEMVGVFSFEMTGDALLEKLVAPWCAGWPEATEGRHIPSRVVDAVTRNRMDKLRRVFIRDESTLTVERILEEADRLIAMGCRVFALDYIQRVDLDLEDPAQMRFGIQKATSALARHAKERGVVWIALSQISRGGDSGPSLATLKEAGAIEEDAAWVLSIHQNSADDRDQREVRILKNRYGGHGEEIVRVDWRFQRFPFEPTPGEGARW